MMRCFVSTPSLLRHTSKSASVCRKRHRTVTCSSSASPNENESMFKKLASPKFFKTATDTSSIHGVPLAALRVVAGVLMIHHGSEGGLGPANFGTPEFDGFVNFIMKPYFSFLPGPLEVWAALHDYVEFFGGILLALGAGTRLASLGLALCMGSAVYFHIAANGLQGFPLGHVPNYSYDFEEPMLYLFIFLVYFMNGAGLFSIDNIIYKTISAEPSDE